MLVHSAELDAVAEAPSPDAGLDADGAVFGEGSPDDTDSSEDDGVSSGDSEDQTEDDGVSSGDSEDQTDAASPTPSRSRRSSASVSAAPPATLLCNLALFLLLFLYCMRSGKIHSCKEWPSASPPLQLSEMHLYGCALLQVVRACLRFCHTQGVCGVVRVLVVCTRCG